MDNVVSIALERRNFRRDPFYIGVFAGGSRVGSVWSRTAKLKRAIGGYRWMLYTNNCGLDTFVHADTITFKPEY